MTGEVLAAESTLAQAIYWRATYVEMLEFEEKVLAKIRQLMKLQSDRARREVELTNVPVVVAQLEKCRHRLGYWTARILELEGA